MPDKSGDSTQRSTQQLHHLIGSVWNGRHCLQRKYIYSEAVESHQELKWHESGLDFVIPLFLTLYMSLCRRIQRLVFEPCSPAPFLFCPQARGCSTMPSIFFFFVCVCVHHSFPANLCLFALFCLLLPNLILFYVIYDPSLWCCSCSWRECTTFPNKKCTKKTGTRPVLSNCHDCTCALSGIPTRLTFPTAKESWRVSTKRFGSSSRTGRVGTVIRAW